MEITLPGKLGWRNGRQAFKSGGIHARIIPALQDLILGTKNMSRQTLPAAGKRKDILAAR
jgi:hypothetical protein